MYKTGCNLWQWNSKTTLSDVLASLSVRCIYIVIITQVAASHYNLLPLISLQWKENICYENQYLIDLSTILPQLMPASSDACWHFGPVNYNCIYWPCLCEVIWVELNFQCLFFFSYSRCYPFNTISYYTQALLSISIDCQRLVFRSVCLSSVLLSTRLTVDIDTSDPQLGHSIWCSKPACVPVKACCRRFWIWSHGWWMASQRTVMWWN